VNDQHRAPAKASGRLGDEFPQGGAVPDAQPPLLFLDRRLRPGTMILVWCGAHSASLDSERSDEGRGPVHRGIDHREQTVTDARKGDQLGARQQAH